MVLRRRFWARRRTQPKSQPSVPKETDVLMGPTTALHSQRVGLPSKHDDYHTFDPSVNCCSWESQNGRNQPVTSFKFTSSSNSAVMDELSPSPALRPWRLRGQWPEDTQRRLTKLKWMFSVAGLFLSVGKETLSVTLKCPPANENLEIKDAP